MTNTNETKTNIELRLSTPIEVNFQTSFNDNKIDYENLKKPIEVGQGKIYLFPKGFSLEEMLSEAKKIRIENKYNKNSFGEGDLIGEQEILVENGLIYMDKARKMNREISDYLKTKDDFSIEKETIQGSCFEDRVYSLNQSLMEFFSSGYNRSNKLKASYFIDCTQKDHKISFRLFKPEGTIESLDQIEKFYGAIKTKFEELLD